MFTLNNPLFFVSCHSFAQNTLWKLFPIPLTTFAIWLFFRFKFFKPNILVIFIQCSTVFELFLVEVISSCFVCHDNWIIYLRGNHLSISRLCWICISIYKVKCAIKKIFWQHDRHSRFTQHLNATANVCCHALKSVLNKSCNKQCKETRMTMFLARKIKKIPSVIFGCLSIMKYIVK